MRNHSQRARILTSSQDLQAKGQSQVDSEEVPLLPKLRGYFAKFLREGSPTLVGILYLTILDNAII